jgi:hypothetical protein
LRKQKNIFQHIKPCKAGIIYLPDDIPHVAWKKTVRIISAIGVLK